jgi:CheY-like chemotaxis protein
VTHILVVDDDPAIRDVISDILEMASYTVDTASNGAEALAQVGEARPAAILLDLMMPVMDGWNFLRECRGEPTCAQVPIIVMSAAPDVDARLGELGVQTFLPKPFEMDDVLRAVERLTVSDETGGGPIRANGY